MARTRGYHYARRADGSKYRVYTRSARMGRGRRATGRRPKGIVRRRRGGRASGGSTYSGFGAYKRTGRQGGIRGTGPGLMYAMGHGNIEANVPKIKNSKGGVVRIQHTEYLFDVLATQGFTNNAFIINPEILPTILGLSLADGGFSIWLNNVAANFEEWKARGICFHFKSTSADNSTLAGSAMGTVSMATNYNALNPNFSSKQVMENYEGATSTKPSKNQNHFVECSNKQTPVHPMYIRTGPVPSGGDQRLYDIGIFQLATNGMAAAATNASVIGELWVSYEIDFFKPRINPVPDGIWDHFVWPGAQAVNTAMIPATPFSTVGGALKYASTESTAGGMITQGNTTAAQCQTSPGAAKDSFLGGVVVNSVLTAPTNQTYYFPLDAPIGSTWLLMYACQGLTAGIPGASTWTPIQSITGSNSCIVSSSNTTANLGFHAITGTQQVPGVTTVGFVDQAGAGTATSLFAVANVTILTANAGVTFSNAGAQATNGGNQSLDFYAVMLGSPADSTVSSVQGQINAIFADLITIDQNIVTLDNDVGVLNADILALQASTTKMVAQTWTNAALKAGTNLTMLTATPGIIHVPQTIVMKMVYGGSNIFTNAPNVSTAFNPGGFLISTVGPPAAFWGAANSTVELFVAGNDNENYTDAVNKDVVLILGAALTGNAANDNIVLVQMFYYDVTI